jgi:hypothetical protein
MEVYAKMFAVKNQLNVISDESSVSLNETW